MGDIFRQSWFWWVLAGSVYLIAVILNRFRAKKGVLPHRRLPPIPKKHEKLISRVADIFIICILVLAVLVLALIISRFLIMVFEILSDTYLDTDQRLEMVRSVLPAFFITLIVFSAASAPMIGFLSPFQKDLSKSKRIFLLIICVLPVIFMVVALLIGPDGFSPRTIKLCLASLLPCWFFNGPAIILGKTFIEFMSPLHNWANRYIWLMDTESTGEDSDH